MTDVPQEKYDLEGITQNVLELSKLSFECEEKREQSLINQSSQMASAFAFTSAALLMLFSVVLEYFPSVSQKYVATCGIIILILLIVSLVLALLIQWRFKYEALPSPQAIYDHELSESSAVYFNTPQQRNAAFVKTLDKVWKSKHSLNNRRVTLLRTSMIMFFSAMAVFLLTVLIGTTLFI